MSTCYSSPATLYTTLLFSLLQGVDQGGGAPIVEGPWLDEEQRLGRSHKDMAAVY